MPLALTHTANTSTLYQSHTHTHKYRNTRTDSFSGYLCLCVALLFDPCGLLCSRRVSFLSHHLFLGLSVRNTRRLSFATQRAPRRSMASSRLSILLAMSAVQTRPPLTGAPGTLSVMCGKGTQYLKEAVLYEFAYCKAVARDLHEMNRIVKQSR